MKITERARGIEYAIRDVIAPAKKLEKKGAEVLHLNIGDPNKYDFDTPNFMKKALEKAVEEGHNGYASSKGLKQAREAAAEREKRVNGTYINPEKTLVTAGVTEGIQFIYGALLNADDEVLIPEPAYPLYESMAKFFSAQPVFYRTDEDNHPVTEDIEQKITDRTRALVVINPNNPTGAVYPESVLKEIVELAGQHDLLLISDEIYDLLAFKEFKSLGAIADDVPCVVFNGLSKNYLAPGWRTAYAGFKNCDELFEACLKEARNRLSSVAPMQYAMAEALKREDHVKETKQKLEKRRDITYRKLDEAPGISCGKPEGAFYAFPKLENVENDEKWVLDLLEEKNVLTVFGSGFGAPGHFRIVFLPPEDVLIPALDKIKEFQEERVSVTHD